MTRRTTHRRVVALGAVATAGVLATSAALTAPADAAAVGVKPARIINVGAFFPLLAIADDGTIYASTSSAIEVWAPSSNGRPQVVKTFTGTTGNGVPSLGAGGLAYTGSAEVTVIDPSQADGPAVPTRTITGAATLIDSPAAVAWTPTGSLWVIDTVVAGDGGLELLRFAPGADGNVAPVQRISGVRTGLETAPVLGAFTLAGLPGNGLAVAPAGVEPSISVFTATQSGNVTPSRHIDVASAGPHFLSQGLAADPQGRIYIGSGDLNGNQFGRLDVYGPKSNGRAKPLLTLGGGQQRFQIPLVPAVAPNGTLALADATILDFGGSTIQYTQVKVFNPLFSRPGAPKSLKAKASGKTASFSWKAASNASGTPVSYKVVVKKGSKTSYSKTLGTTSLKVTRKALPTGKLKVTVTAVTAGGSGPAASKSFKN